jgi:PAS domain S-box-containing protein
MENVSELQKQIHQLQEQLITSGATLAEANNQLKRVEAERELLLIAEHAKTRQQAALVRLSAELAATLEENEICRRVVDGLHDTLDYDNVALYLVEEPISLQDSLENKASAASDRVLVAGAGIPDSFPARIPAGVGLSQRPLLDGELVYTPDVSEDPQYFGGLNGSEVDVPIRTVERVFGVLIVESRLPHTFNQDDFEVLTAVAQQAGLAIEKSWILAAERRRANELEALHTTMANVTAELELPTLLQTIVERATVLLEATGGELGLYEEASREIQIVVSHNVGKGYVGTRHAIGEGVMGYVAESGEPLIIEDFHMWEGRAPQYDNLLLRASMAAPLKVGHRLVGVITINTSDPSRQFGPADLHLLESFAKQAAIAIENARLYDQAQGEINDRIRAETELRKVQEHLEDLVEARTEELKESEERYRTLFAGIPIGLYRTTPDGQIVDGNLTLFQMLGYPSRETGLDVNTASLYVNPGDRARWQSLMEQEGIVRDFDVQLRRHDNVVIWVSDTARAFKDNQGQVLYYEGSMEDITERKRAEAELRKYQEHLEELVEEHTAELRISEERYRSLFDGIPMGLYRTTPSGRVLDANLAAWQMLGYSSREEALKVGIRTIDVYTVPEERARWQQLMEQEGIVRDFEVQLHRSDGTVIWVSDTARVVKDDQGQVLYYDGSLEDITERKRFEREIRRQKEYFEALFINSPAAVATTDLATSVVSWNPMAEKLFGYTQEEAIGQYLDGLVSREHDLQEEAIDYTHQLHTTGRVQATTKCTRKDGSLVDVEVLAVPVVVAEKRVGFIIIFHDISELQKARRAAEAANKAKSTFLANMSHELRTPLNAIIGFTRLVKRYSQDLLPQKQLNNLDKVLTSADHLLGLINTILDLAKIEAGRVDVQPANFNLDPLIDVCLQTVQPSITNKNLSLVKNIETELPPLFTDRDKLRQILINLLSNAIKFTESGTISVIARLQGEDISIAVVDTGIGIAESSLGQIFEAFHQVDGSTTRQYSGTGLGLSISRHLARLMGGDVSVESTVGLGTTCTITLPLCYSAAHKTAPPTFGAKVKH